MHSLGNDASAVPKQITATVSLEYKQDQEGHHERKQGNSFGQSESQDGIPEQLLG